MEDEDLPILTLYIAAHDLKYTLDTVQVPLVQTRNQQLDHNSDSFRKTWRDEMAKDTYLKILKQALDQKTLPRKEDLKKRDVTSLSSQYVMPP